MRWTRLLLILIAVAIAVAALALAALLANPAGLRDPAARFASSLLQRELSIGGEFDLVFGERTTLVVGDLRIANPDWRSNTDFLRIGHAEVTVDLGSLLTGPLIIERLMLRDAVLDLAQDDDGQVNWILGNANDTTEESDSGEPAVLVRELDISGSRIGYEGPGLAEPVLAKIKSLRQSERDDGLLDTTLTGTLNERAVELQGQLGPFKNLLSGKDLHFDLSGQFDSLRLKAGGQVDDLYAPRRPEFEFELKGPDVRDASAMIGLGRIGSGDVDLTGSLGPGSRGMQLDIRGHLGETSVRAEASSANMDDLRSLTLVADLSGPDLGRVMRIAGFKGVPAEPFELSARINRDDKRLRIETLALNFAEASFQLNGELQRFPTLDTATLKLQIDGTDIERFRQLLGISGVATGPFSLTGTLNFGPNDQEILDARLVTDLVTLTIAGPLGDPPDYVGTRLKINAGGDDFARLALALGIPNQLQVPFQADSEIELMKNSLQTRDKLVIRLGEQVVEAEGKIALPPLASGTDLRFRISGTDASRLAVLAQVQEFIAARPYDINGKLRTETAGYRISGLKGSIGTAGIELDGLISRKASLVGSQFRFAASGPELEDLFADSAQFDVPAGPFDFSGRVERNKRSIGLSAVRIRGGRATLSGEGNIGWPLGAESKGDFSVSASGPDLAAVLPELDAFKPTASEFSLEARGNWQGERWTIDALDAGLGDARLTASGVVAQPPATSATRLKVGADVARLDRLGLIAGRSLPALPLKLEGELTGTRNDFRLQNASITLGESDFAGTLAMNIGSEIPSLSIDLRSQLLDLRPFLGDENAGAAPAEPKKKREKGSRRIPEILLPLEALKRLNAQIAWHADRLQMRRLTGKLFEIEGSLENGAIDLQKFHLEGELGQLEGKMTLVPTNGRASVKVNLQGSDIALNVFGEKPEDLDKIPVFNIDMNMSSTGADTRQLAAGLNGSLRLTSRGGRVPKGGLDILTGDFLTQLAETINPFVKQDPYTNLSCTAIIISVRDGQLSTAPAAVAQTDKLNIISEGSIDLRDEELDLTFRTAARKGLGISAAEFINPYFKVAGTLGDPQLALDVKSAAVTGGAAVLTAGLSLLAKAAWDRAFRAEDPCGKAIEDADKLEVK